MNKKELIKNKLEEALGYQCEVWFERGSPYGWIFTTDQTHPQRIGYNYKQTIRFIEEYDWEWLKSHLSEIKHENTK